jgi:hypothetical protein
VWFANFSANSSWYAEQFLLSLSLAFFCTTLPPATANVPHYPASRRSLPAGYLFATGGNPADNSAVELTVPSALFC